MLGQEASYFIYSYSLFDDDTVEAVRAASYKMTFTCAIGLAIVNNNVNWPRLIRYYINHLKDKFILDISTQ